MFKQNFSPIPYQSCSSKWTSVGQILTFSLANCYGVVSGLTNDSTPIITSLFFLMTCLLATTLVHFCHLKNLKNKWQLKLFSLGTISFLIVNLFASPAQALFFQNAENFFTTNFTSSASAISIVFASLRGLYILYVAVSLIGVINSVRQDEDWLATAKMPAQVVVSVTLADVLTDVIIA